MTEEQIVKNFDEVNATFTEFIKILPFIELRDIETFDGKRIKLRTQLADESLMTTYTAAMIFLNYNICYIHVIIEWMSHL